MEIQNGKLFVNRTWRYVYPCLKYYGKELETNLKKFFKLGVGLGDINFDKETIGKPIFILFETDSPQGLHMDTVQYKKDFATFLKWVKYQPYYIDDYVFTGIHARKQHMLVLKLPAIHSKSLDNFKRGEYSKMYSQGNIYDYFEFVTLSNKEAETLVNDEITNVRNVLLKNKTYVSEFAKKVNKRFGTDNPSSDFADAELDFPPEPDEEIFNRKLKISMT